MKRFIILLLIMTIQVTFIQKVMASVALSKGETQSASYCKMMMDSGHCNTEMMSMNDCQNDCDLMSVVSVTHFIENNQLLSLAYSQYNYPSFNISPLHSQPTSLFRPPLFS
ncbi:hypothetical protein [uncultured Psychromonas sp.]|uniref:hypothetical protein n=1 Tax=uncultured Psychromonas sp. TaxID=173974 RepID=UPI00261B6D7C|nr:hypothetical protein [uncultured Psychromonas sp.]